MRKVFALCLQAIAPKLRRRYCDVSLPNIGAKEPAALPDLSGASKPTPKVPSIGAKEPAASPGLSGASKPTPKVPNIGAKEPAASPGLSGTSKQVPRMPNIGFVSSCGTSMIGLTPPAARLSGEERHSVAVPVFGADSKSISIGREALLNSSSPISGGVGSYVQSSKLTLLNVLEDTERARQRATHPTFDAKLRDFACEVRARDPMNLGSKRGKAYAATFVAQFVVWYEDLARLQGARHGLEIAVLAHGVFAKVSGLEMPIVRNFLGALKRHPGVQVEEHRRIYDDKGCFVGKGTFYLLPARKVGEGNPFEVPARSRRFLKNR